MWCFILLAALESADAVVQISAACCLCHDMCWSAMQMRCGCQSNWSCGICGAVMQQAPYCSPATWCPAVVNAFLWLMHWLVVTFTSYCCSNCPVVRVKLMSGVRGSAMMFLLIYVTYQTIDKMSCSYSCCSSGNNDDGDYPLKH